MDWSVAYDNRAAVPGAAALPERWTQAASAFAATMGERHTRLAYGPGARESLDLFAPEGTSRGLAVFVHGGYWQRNGPEMFFHLGAGALARGFTVAVPGYTLCPGTWVSAITAEIAAAVSLAATQVAGPVHLSGHSAGGHLVARLLCRGALGVGVAERLAPVLSISGIHDLRPLLNTPMNTALGLDLAEARTESPSLLDPIAGAALTAWVGAEELPELRRQSRLIVETWGALGRPMQLVEDTGHDHFSVIEALADPESPIVEAWLGN